MRQQSKVQVTVRGRVIGGLRQLICLPLVAKEKASLVCEAAELAALQPDMVEWRVDGFFEAEDSVKCLSVLQELRTIIGELPIIFTCRIDKEGGMQHLDREVRLALITGAMESGLVDLVDIELCNDREFIAGVCARGNALGVKVILSYHNFEETPHEDFLLDKMILAEKLGGNIAKIAVMPKDQGDVLALLAVTNRARNDHVKIPLVTISMGEVGKISRLAGGLFGSDITFGAGREASAPGQLAFHDLKKGIMLLYGEV